MSSHCEECEDFGGYCSRHDGELGESGQVVTADSDGLTERERYQAILDQAYNNTKGSFA